MSSSIGAILLLEEAATAAMAALEAAEAEDSMTVVSFSGLVGTLAQTKEFTILQTHSKT